MSDAQSAPTVPASVVKWPSWQTRVASRAARTGPERIRKLAQAALNADVTVEQVDTILEGLSETLIDLNNSTANLDATLERFNDTINSINELAPRLIAVVDRLEGIVSRVERIVGIGESVMFTAGRDGTGGPRRGEQGPQEHRPLVPSTLPVPEPPVAEGTGLPWDVSVDDAVETIAAARARHGDTFAVQSGDDQYLFTFSPAGVESFYGLAEEKASKGVADYLMLRRKLPDEIFDGRRILPTSLFRRDDVASYLANLDRALEHTVAELGPDGVVDLFGLTRRLGHRMGLASWAGPGSAEGDSFERLVVAFETLDGSDAFVHPDAMAAVAASGKQAERAALDEVVAVVETAVRRMTSGDVGDEDLFGRIVDAWSSEPDDVRIRGIGLDVALIHIASMSNLMAALGWALVDLLEHPAQRERVAER